MNIVFEDEANSSSTPPNRFGSWAPAYAGVTPFACRKRRCITGTAQCPDPASAARSPEL